MRHRILLAAAFVYLTVANVIWIAKDTRPPFWDMAAHATGALRIYDAFASDGLSAITAIPLKHLTGYYPPFYHTVIAGLWAVFGKSLDVAQLGNLIAIGVLLLSTYGIGRHLFDPFTSAVAAVLANFYPLMVWLSRETILDYWITAMVALAVWVLLKSKGFSNRKWSVAFGIVAGLGMLTKWTFPFFLILPAIWAARQNWKNAMLGATTAAALTAYWYLPSVSELKAFLEINTAGGVFEGDPSRLSLNAIIFYWRALEGYQLFLPLFVAFVAGLLQLKRDFTPRWMTVVLWLVGGWLGLLLFQNKDPRYSAPLLPAVALITAPLFNRGRMLVAALMVLLAFQHYLVSFGLRALPDAVVLMEGVRGELTWNWNLYTQSYFGLWGPPEKEDWQIEHVLRKVSSGPNDTGVVLGLVPDIPRFDSLAFQFYIQLRDYDVHLRRIGIFDEAALLSNAYVLASETHLPHAASFAADSRINTYIMNHPNRFQVTERFALPNGEIIRLYKFQ